MSYNVASLKHFLLTISRFQQFIAPHLPLIVAWESLHPATTSVPLLAAMYYVAQNFTAFDDYLCIQIVYDSPPLNELWDFVMKRVNHKNRHASTGLLQAMLVLAAAPAEDVLKPNFEQRQSLGNDANTMAQALGLYHDAGLWPISSTEKRSRKRLSWSLRIVDSWNAAASGRQCCISEDDWLVQGLMLEDFSASEIDTGQAAVALEMAKLTNILREVMRQLL